MEQLPKIVQASAMNSDEIIVTLSDDRNLVFAVAQLLTLKLRVLPPDPPDED